MSLLGNVLSAAGFGQNEIKLVTTDTLKGIDENTPMMTPDMREGAALFGREMLKTLRDGDVITAATHRELADKIQKWLSKGPTKTKK